MLVFASIGSQHSVCCRMLHPVQELFEQARQAAEDGNHAWARPGTVHTGYGSTAGSSSGSSYSPGTGYGRKPATVIEAQAKSEWAEAERLTREASAMVLQAANVVVTTCAGAGDPYIASR